MEVGALSINEAQATLAAANRGLETLSAEGLARADAAAWLLLRHHLSRIASGLVDPWAGLEVIEAEVRWPYLVQLQMRSYPWRYACESHDYHHLYGLYVDYGDLTGRPHEVTWDGLYGEAAVAAWGRSVVAEARGWLQRHAEPVAAPDTAG
ncbi:hypothetical protein [Gemmata obscuriglobus]|uniref:hypothetical protein n=1 Tax=Gemmata obscuriglobus TaxID=114 RepID=UPI0002E6F767|nr:hypothetical protein [Gemmata obscuriglobus]